MSVRNVAYVTTNNATTRVTVIGKTERVGTASTHMALAQRRANTVRNALVAAGVPTDRIDTSWAGEAWRQMRTADDVVNSRNRIEDVSVVRQPW